MRVRSLLIGAAVLLVAVLGYAWFAGQRTVPLPPTETPPAPAVAQPPVDRAPSPEPVQRDAVKMPEPAVPEAAEEEEPFDPSPVQVEPWLARFLVVDEDEQPVADAVVTIWASKKIRSNPRMTKLTGRTHNSYSGHGSEPLLELRTDAAGRAQQVLELECCSAAATKYDVGRSREQYLWNTRASEKETKFVLEVPITLRGVVLRADGTPAGGAKVIAHVNGSSGIVARPEPVTASADGRFELPVHLHAVYSLKADLDGVRTLTERAWIRTRQPPEAVLLFPGAITLAGIVVDAGGRPVAKARVSAWREFHLGEPEQDPNDYEHVTARTGEDGRFSVDVRRHARYQLVASADGHANSELLWVGTTATRPHTDVTLELLSFARIEGRVERGDGLPLADVRVSARPETGYAGSAVVMPSQQDLFARVALVTTDDDGRFALSVHPKTTWTVYAYPLADNHRLRVQQTGVAPGRDDVVMCIRDADLAGCVVHGTVVRADGLPVGNYQVEIVNYEDGRQRSSGDARASVEGDRFTLPPLPLGREYAIRVALKDDDAPHARYGGPLAPAQVGPFTTDQPELQFEVRLVPWGEVPVRVLDAAGAPAHRVRAMATREVDPGFVNPAQPVDVNGRVVLKRCAPGAHHLRVFSFTEQLSEQELLITPGLNPEVVVRLPETAPPKDR